MGKRNGHHRRRYRPARPCEAWETEALGQSAVEQILTDELAARCARSPEDIEAVELRARAHWRAVLQDPANVLDGSDAS